MLTVLTALTAAGLSGIIPSYRSTLSTVEHMMSTTAVLAAERVEQELTAYKNAAMDAGCIPQLSDPNVSLQEKQKLIKERCDMHLFQRGNIIGLNGHSIFDEKDYSDREYVIQAMRGNLYVSEPLISKVTGELSIMAAAPLYSGGIYGSSIAGAVYFVPKETFLNDIVSSIHIGDNSRAYMINKSGDTIADITLDTIMVQNIEAEAQEDSSLKELAAIHARMREGENGFGSYQTMQTVGEQAKKQKMFIAYAPVPNTDGWSIAVTAPQKNYLSAAYKAMAINLAVMAASLLISMITALLLANNIGKPMKACANRMQLLVEGDLETPVPEVKKQRRNWYAYRVRRFPCRWARHGDPRYQLPSDRTVQAQPRYTYRTRRNLCRQFPGYFNCHAPYENAAEHDHAPGQPFRGPSIGCQQPALRKRPNVKRWYCRTGKFCTAACRSDECNIQ